MSSESTPGLVFLIDSSNLVYRSFYAIRELTTSKGFPTNAIHGVLKTLRLWLREYSPSHFAMVIDGETPQERLELIPGYKSSRPPMPDALEQQLPVLCELVELMGVPQIEDPKQEADDLIASLAVRALGQGRDVMIASNDKDFFQLLRPGLRILRQTPGQNAIVDEAWLRDHWGLRPAQVVDYLSLVGDSVDEVRGVHGVGEKTALKWLQQYESIEGIYEHLGELPARFQSKLGESRRLLETNRKVIRLREDLGQDIRLESLRPRLPEYERLCRRLRELEFKGLPLELERESAKCHPQGELFG